MYCLLYKLGSITLKSVALLHNAVSESKLSLLAVEARM